MKTKQLILSTVALAVATSFVSNSALALTADDVICDKCIGTADIANGAITTFRLREASVTTGKIRSRAVQQGKIADNAVINRTIAPDAVTADKIAAGAVGQSEIATSGVASSEILDNSVTGTDILNSTITGSDIASNSVSSGDLSNEAGIDYNTANTIDYAIENIVKNVRTVTVTRPTSGYITCTATGLLDYDAADTNGYMSVGWFTSNSSIPGLGTNTSAGNLAGTSTAYIPWTAVHTFAVSGSGTSTYYLNVDGTNWDANTTADLYVYHTQCVYYPTRY